MICKNCRVQYSGSHECEPNVVFYICDQCYKGKTSQYERDPAFKAFIKELKVKIKVVKNSAKFVKSPRLTCYCDSIHQIVLDIVNGKQKIAERYLQLANDPELTERINESTELIIDSSEVDK